MIYSIGGKRLNCIRKVLENEVNDVWIAEDISAEGNKQYYTLLVIKKHETAKTLMEIWEAGRNAGRKSGAQMAAWKEEFCVVYPYRKERLLEKFYNGAACSGKECGQICMNLIAECISGEEPWPLLYLLLKQRQINLAKDYSVSFSYLLDLSGLSAETDERACVMKCADIVLEIMRQNKDMEKTIGKKLVQKKLLKEGYAGFTELFRDIHMDAGAWEKVKPLQRVKAFLREKKSRILRILLVLSVLLGIIALLMILSQIVFGDIPFLRIFTNSFRTIGSESLLN